MNKFLRTTLLLCLWLTTTTVVAESIDELKSRIANNMYYRLKSYYNTYATDMGGNVLTISNTIDLTNSWNSIWKIVAHDDGYTLQNVLSGRYLNSISNDNRALPVSATPQTFYIKPSTYTSDNAYVVLSWTSNFIDKTVVHADQHGRVVRWNANTSVTANNASDWILEAISSVDETAVENYREAITPETGVYYYLVNKEYAGKRMQSQALAGAALLAADSDETEYRQLWMLEQIGDEKYAFKNVATGLYIQNNAGKSNDFVTGTGASPFSLSFSVGNAPFSFSATGTNYALHAANTQGYHIVGWYSDANASQWYLQRATVNETDVQAAIKTMQELQGLINNRADITTRLAIFFDDAACTTLKSAYRDKNDEELRQLMTDAGLPSVLQDMAVRVKNNQWNNHSELANQYEKSFRIATYIPHSDPRKWAQDNRLMRTSFSYSQLTTPTGITASKGDVLCIFVNETAPAGTTLQAELASGINRTGRQVTLQKGANFIYAEGKEHVYIRYNIEDTNLRIADLPEIKIHIENGRANGCFDISRHDNQAWRDMLTLKDAGFMQDDEWRMKSRRYTYIFRRSDVEKGETDGSYNYRGEYKGLKGVLTMWDNICDEQLDFLSVERYADRFNCVLLAVNQADGLYATVYGIYGVTALSYRYLAESYEDSEGREIWALAHETGHHFQYLFNMQGAKESSNNLFSNIAMWRTGTNVTRGMSLPALINNCLNSGNSWTDLGLSERMRLYWQLYLYYVELGHKPTFFKELFDKFRETPMKDGNGKTDFLLFAKTCSEVAEEDLTEFFEFYGFFRKTGENLNISWGDAFYDKYYGFLKTNVSQEDINEAKTFMARYPKKRNNLFFIDERIRPTENKNSYMLPGAPRYATSGNATPGDANEVGDVGHFTDFATEKPARPNSVQLQGRTFTMTGEDVVGYKVYDAAGNLVRASNRNSFDIPETLNLQDIRVVAAGSDGTDVIVYENGIVKPEYNVAGMDKDFLNEADLALSVNEIQPEYLYKIYLTSNNQAFLAGNTTKAATKAEQGKFAFYAGTAEGTYYIYSETVGKWLGYSDSKDGNNKIKLYDTKGSGSQWRVVKEKGKTSVDILPLTGNRGWNWYGGINESRTSMGFYDMNDNNSSWTLQAVDEATTLKAEEERIGNLLDKHGVGYPADDSADRVMLKQKLDNYKAAYSNMMEAVATLKENPTAENQTAALNASMAFRRAGIEVTVSANSYMAATANIVMPRNGKIYRIKYVHNKRSVTSHHMPDDTQGHNIILAPCTDIRSLWVCQYNTDGTFTMASLAGNGCLSVSADGTAATLKDRGQDFSAIKGSSFGTLALQGGGYSMLGTTTADYLGATTDGQVAATNNTRSTDFYFEEVADSAFALSIKKGSNGNLSTLNLPFAVVLSKDVKVYAATRASENLRLREYALSTEADGKKILPAYTAVILSTQESGKIELYPAPSVPTGMQAGMEGSISRIPNSQLQLSTYNYYALTQVDGRYLMRKIRNAAIPANKAYYRIGMSPAAAPPMSLGFIFDDETTDIGISTNDKEGRDGNMYDLSGRKIKQKPAQGIIIIGGKKVMQH